MQRRQPDPRLTLLELRRLLRALRAEFKKMGETAKPTVTDKPEPDDEILSVMGQGQWKRYIVHRERRN